ncbi:hypothetical protein CXIVA_09590 [Clostridium sp. SY8519]|uniref:DNA polymerase III subunit beta n=1 Tax=Clostridium sp. (strain SY8519) TaxID=1042156 RepID=UPI0002171A34|nr:DNA polymerase III subunit beta [Clostridium sp. SY8519]BAK46926.1 hypothetical protein CXIVA_09590 [Clostridium sp. SY8519]
MKITCQKADLLKAVNIVSKAVPTRTTMPILECILLDASADTFKLTANDMELGIETIVTGTIEERGSIALDARVFSDIVRKLPDSTVVIDTSHSMQTTITCGKAQFTIVGKEGDDFPYLPYVERSEAITISQFTLKEVIKQTLFATADNDSNKIMTGEFFSSHDSRLQVVALDGHRIAIRNIELKKAYAPQEMIVPGKTLQEISKILTGEIDSMVDIYATPNHILFEFDGTKVVSRLLEGKYFQIEQMLSDNYETTFRINKKDLYDCVERASLLISESDKKPIIMKIRDGKVDMLVRSFIGSMNEEIDIEKEGRDLTIGFDPKFFIDALRVIDDEEISLYLINSKAPCFIKDDAGSYIYLILPVNFNERDYED